MLGSGNLGLIYLMEEQRRLTLEEIDERHPELIPALREHPHVGWLLVRSASDGAVVLGAGGARYLNEDRVEGEDPLADFSPTRARHLLRTDGFAHVADIMVGSFYDPVLDEGCAFEELISFHGGLGGPQTRPFILHPPRPAARHRTDRGRRGRTPHSHGLAQIARGTGSRPVPRRAEPEPSPAPELTLDESRRPSRLSRNTGSRGRAAGRASSPLRCPADELRPLAVMARRAGRHELIDRGAALTYYGVLALIPALLVLFSVIGLFGNQGTVDSVLEIVDDVGPSDGDRSSGTRSRR